MKSLVIDISNICNFDCKYCSASKVRHVDKKIFQDVDKLLEMITKFGNRMMIDIAGGGEPFIHPDIKKLLLELHKLDCYVRVFSNMSKVEPYINLLKETRTYLIPTFHYTECKRLNFTKKFLENVKNCHELVEDVMCIIDGEFDFNEARKAAEPYNINLIPKYEAIHKTPRGDKAFYEITGGKKFGPAVSYKNKLVRCGSDHITIMSNGKIIPCFPVKIDLGTIENPKLLCAPMRCPSEICECSLPLLCGSLVHYKSKYNDLWRTNINCRTPDIYLTKSEGKYLFDSSKHYCGIGNIVEIAPSNAVSTKILAASVRATNANPLLTIDNNSILPQEKTCKKREEMYQFATPFIREAFTDSPYYPYKWEKISYLQINWKHTSDDILRILMHWQQFLDKNALIVIHNHINKDCEINLLDKLIESGKIQIIDTVDRITSFKISKLLTE